MNFTDAVNDPDYRKQLQEMLVEYGALYLHNMLRKIDPDTADRLHHNDTRRIVRALEVYHVSGKP